MLATDLIRHGLEFHRAIENNQYEITPTGIHFPKQKAVVHGAFETMINGADLQLDPNIVPVEALNYLLKLGLTNSGGLAAWYVAPFTNNVTPLSTLTAATFESVLNEFTTYDEATRVQYVVPTDPTSGSYTNSASPAAFTIGAVGGSGVAIYGAGILSASAKESTSGKIFCASKFATARTVFEDDILSIQYTVSASST